MNNTYVIGIWNRDGRLHYLCSDGHFRPDPAQAAVLGEADKDALRAKYRGCGVFPR